MNLRLSLVGVHVQEREVALAQRDEVALGAEVVAATATGSPSRVTVNAELGLARRPCSRPRSSADPQAVDVDARRRRGQRARARRRRRR